MKEPTPLSVSVVIPCLNDQREIGNVVREFRELLPEGKILVVDNCSTKETIDLAREAGADVIVERRRGKAQAVISALPYIDSDVLLLANGDGSYPVEGARRLIEFYRWEHPDMVVGVPKGEGAPEERRGFRERILRFVFGHPPENLDSELRLLSKYFYKNIPILLRGFNLEMELTVQALDKNFRTASAPVPFVSTHAAVASERHLTRFRGVWDLLHMMVVLLRDYKPMVFFGGIASLFALAGLIIGAQPIYDYFTTGIVHRLSLPVLAASLMIIAFFTFQIGVVLASSLRYRRETYQTQLRRHYDAPADR